MQPVLISSICFTSWENRLVHCLKTRVSPFLKSVSSGRNLLKTESVVKIRPFPWVRLHNRDTHHYMEQEVFNSCFIKTLPLFPHIIADRCSRLLSRHYSLSDLPSRLFCIHSYFYNCLHALFFLFLFIHLKNHNLSSCCECLPFTSVLWEFLMRMFFLIGSVSLPTFPFHPYSCLISTCMGFPSPVRQCSKSLTCLFFSLFIDISAGTSRLICR